ncbi:MAG: YbaB/EbfC family nucleoid-associated protein [Holophagales bacterium]|nr:YbaB/EbfC family nucleoid-associated protein [Holophagales bacterium]
MNMQKLLKQAQDMQDKMQRELGETHVESSVGGGLVKVKLNGHKHLLSVEIDPDVFSSLEDPGSRTDAESIREKLSDDLEILQDLIIAAVNDGNKKMDEALRERVGMIASGLPDLF